MKTFYIPKPCHENWNLMTPQEQGRHCAVCSKVVVDFTQKTPVQIEQVIGKAEEGSVCGNFNINQLDAKAQRKVFLKPLNLFNRNWKYLAFALFGFLLLSKKAEAQKTRGKVMLRGDVAPMDTHNTNTDTSKLQGSIKNNIGETLAGATVIVQSGDKEISQVVSLANGRYVIKLAPGQVFNKKITVSIYHPMYETKFVHDLSIVKETTTLNVVMDEMVMLMGIVEYLPPVDTVKTEIEKPKDSVSQIPNDSVSTNDINGIEQKPNQHLFCDSPKNTNEQKTNTETTQNNMVIRPEDVESIVFPNPTNSTATVFCNKTDTYVVTVYDAKGGVLHTQHFTGNKTDLDVSGFERGNYIVTVNGTQNNTSRLKLIKQ